MDVVTMLRLVRQNMDEIPVIGINHQNRMVGCAQVLDAVINDLQEAQKATEENTNTEHTTDAPESNAQEVSNGR